VQQPRCFQSAPPLSYIPLYWDLEIAPPPDVPLGNFPLQQSLLKQKKTCLANDVNSGLGLARELPSFFTFKYSVCQGERPGETCPTRLIPTSVSSWTSSKDALHLGRWSIHQEARRTFHIQAAVTAGSVSYAATAATSPRDNTQCQSCRPVLS